MPSEGVGNHEGVDRENRGTRTRHDQRLPGRRSPDTALNEWEKGSREDASASPHRRIAENQPSLSCSKESGA